MGCEVLGLRRSVAWCAPSRRAFGAGSRSQQPREKLPFSKVSPRHAVPPAHHITTTIPLLSISATARAHLFSSFLFDSFTDPVANARSCRLHRPSAARPLARIPEPRTSRRRARPTPETPSSSPPPTARPPPSQQRPPPSTAAPRPSPHRLRYYCSRRVATQRQYALRLVPRAAYARSPLPANRSCPRLALEPCQHSCPTFDNITSAAAHAT